MQARSISPERTKLVSISGRREVYVYMLLLAIPCPSPAFFEHLSLVEHLQSLLGLHRFIFANSPSHHILLHLHLFKSAKCLKEPTPICTEMSFSIWRALRPS
jgi:hypothetical protein